MLTGGQYAGYMAMDKIKEFILKLEHNVTELLNKERKAVRRVKKKPLFLWILTIAAACVIGFGTMYYELYAKQRKESYQRVYDALTLTFQENTPGVFEYSPGKLQLISYVASSNGTVSVSPETVDLKTLGTTKAVYTVSQTDEYGQNVRKTFERTFQVEDNRPPMIDVPSSVTVKPGDRFEPGAWIESVADPVDGELHYEAEKPQNSGNGWYTVTHNVDTSQEGSYMMTITACDRNGNTAETNVNVLVASQLREQVMASWQLSSHWYEADEMELLGVDIENGSSTDRYVTQQEAIDAFGQLPKAILTDGCEMFREPWYYCESCSVLSDRYYIVRGIDSNDHIHYYRIVYSYTSHGEGYVDPETGRWSFTSWFLD